ncbi:hypothetical protein [Thalassolituus sp.]|uniref:hypothetical protein n=1 Tax=Thalassolituus sp. TaxID=2030822 RepID=UPI0026301189|nr:hypothetical protein [Thalassolituus sp.]
MSDEVMSVDDALASGDPDQIEKALAAHAGEDNSNEQDEAEAETPEETEAAEAEADSGDDSESDGEPSGQDEEERAPIATKDGKHTIPYEVLEAARQREADLKRQLDEANARLSESDKQISNAKANLDRQGVDMDSAFADPDAITEKELADVEEDYGYGSMEAKLARILFKSQQAQTQQAEAVNQAQAEVDDAEAAAARSAFQNNSDLTNWQAKDPDRWDMALTIDQKLQADPKWQNATPADRFAEVAKRTKAAFGDAVAEQKSVKQRAKEIVDNAETPTPNSLTDIGQAPGTEKSLRERLESMSDAEREAEMAKMSDAQIQEVMSWY